MDCQLLHMAQDLRGEAVCVASPLCPPAKGLQSRGFDLRSKLRIDSGLAFTDEGREFSEGEVIFLDVVKSHLRRVLSDLISVGWIEGIDELVCELVPCFPFPDVCLGVTREALAMGDKSHKGRKLVRSGHSGRRMMDEG